MLTEKNKDNLPVETVRNIKQILKKTLNLELSEGMMLTEKNKFGETALCSTRVFWKKPAVGTNGKGTKAEYALASAYSEFMERLQNRAILSDEYNAPDIKYINKEFFLNSELKNFYDRFYREISFAREDISLEKMIDDWQEYASEFSEKKVKCVEFFNVNEDKTVFVPLLPILENICSNGMCAGNTREEALVQGISEILERYCAKKIILNDYLCPIIPEENYISNPNIRKILDTFNEHGYRIEIRDASLNKKFPVVMGIVSKGDLYCTNFGAHPILHIAIERTFTEILQGFTFNKDFENKKMFHLDDFYKNDEDKISCFTEQKWKIQYSKLADALPLWEFNEQTWIIENTPNKILLSRYIELLKSYNYDILIRDVSFLGFPSLHVVVPQLSVMMFSPKSIWAKRKKLLKSHLQIEIPVNQIKNNFFYKMLLILIYLKENDYPKAIEAIDDYIVFLNGLNNNQVKHKELIKCLRDYIQNKNRNLVQEDNFYNLYQKYDQKVILTMLNKFIKSSALDRFISEHTNSENNKNNEFTELLNSIYRVYEENLPRQDKIRNILIKCF